MTWKKHQNNGVPPRINNYTAVNLWSASLFVFISMTGPYMHNSLDFTQKIRHVIATYAVPYLKDCH